MRRAIRTKRHKILRSPVDVYDHLCDGVVAQARVKPRIVLHRRQPSVIADSRKGPIMGKGSERARGKAQEIKGAVKARVGDLIDNEQMQLEGQAEQLKGQVRQDMAKAEGQAQGIGEQIVGQAKGAFGKLIGNEQMRVEGKLKELKGKGRQKVNR